MITVLLLKLILDYGICGYSNVEWGDFDADGDLDLLLSGTSGDMYQNGLPCLLYKNINEIFTDIDAGFYDLFNGGFDWGDYDNDGDMDMIVSAGIPQPGAWRYFQTYGNPQKLFMAYLLKL